MFLGTKVKVVIVVIVLLIVGLVGYWLLEKPAAPEFTALDDSNLVVNANTVANTEQDVAVTAPEAAKVFVDIKGAIERPGVYALPADGRVIDVVELAGGLLADADTYQINLAALIYDAMEIIIPKKGEIIKPTPTAGASQSATPGKVNINTANKNQLMSLAGIGEVKAQAIITYREQHGGFAKIEDLMRVSGIGSATFAQIKDLIVV